VYKASISRIKSIDRRLQRLPLLLRGLAPALAAAALTALLGERSTSDLALTFATFYVALVVIDAATLFLTDARRTYDDTRDAYPWSRQHRK